VLRQPRQGEQSLPRRAGKAGLESWTHYEDDRKSSVSSARHPRDLARAFYFKPLDEGKLGLDVLKEGDTLYLYESPLVGTLERRGA
jgi:hypothetical protein